MALTHIKDFIAQKREAGQDLTDLSQDLGVSISSIHYYAKGENKPSLVTAIAIYRKYKYEGYYWKKSKLSKKKKLLN